MARFDTGPGGLPPEMTRGRREIKKEDIAPQLDTFCEQHKIPSLKDRLRIGLNEVAMLAYDQTNALIRQLSEKMAGDTERAEELYQNIVQMCVDIQTRGPWAYVEDFKDSDSLEAHAWFMMVGAESIGYDREMDLNDSEFKADVERIMGHLEAAIANPDAFFAQAKEHLLQEAEKKIRFDKGDTQKRAPIGEGFSAFLPMALQGYEAGVVQDAEGWVFVGARGEITNELIESTGLEAEIAPDDRDPSRTVTFFKNTAGQRVMKKIHPGLLVVLTKKFDVATAVVRALNEEKEMIEIAADALGHVRVIQTSEKKRDDIGMDTGVKGGMEFMHMPKGARASEGPTESTALTRPRTDFYENMLYIRGNYVFVDALRQLEKKRRDAGEEVTEHDKEKLSRYIWDKMRQKVDELEHLNGLLDDRLDQLPDSTRRVIDMAGGAGDLGLAVTNEMLSLGREVDRVDIVDPQEGVADFMRSIIEYLPFRDKLEEIAHHASDTGTGYLQDTEITPDSLVVAKHACGTLTDAIIEQWRDSDSHMLIAMTCCQGKAKHEPARYGFSQSDWTRLCQESDLTNTETDGLSGKELERAKARLEKGKRAMKTLDMARVEYLRRHGFAAELDVTDKFPKGDTIIARRLPRNFMEKLSEIQALEKSDPTAFDTLMMKLDVIAAGGTVKDMDLESYGHGWTRDDFAEIGRRFVSSVFENYVPVGAEPEKPVAPEAGQENKAGKAKEKELMRAVFEPEKGRMDSYIREKYEAAGKELDMKDMGRISGVLKQRILRTPDASAEEIRRALDNIMEEILSE